MRTVNNGSRRQVEYLTSGSLSRDHRLVYELRTRMVADYY